MEIEVDNYDLSVLLKGLGYEEHCNLLANYIEDCCSNGWNVKEWINNQYNQSLYCFDSKEEALEYIIDNKLTVDKDCSIYEDNFYGVVVDIY